MLNICYPITIRYVDNTRTKDYTTGKTSEHLTCRLESVITWRHNKNPGTISYGGGDYGAYMVSDNSNYVLPHSYLNLPENMNEMTTVSVLSGRQLSGAFLCC